MSRIATGIRFTDRQSNRGYGYLAIFSDGDVRRHTTNFPKSHCVRVTLARHFRWQSCPIYPGREVRDGMQQHEFGGHNIYEWFKTEEEAVREVRKAASMTLRDHLSEGYHGSGRIHPLNAPHADEPYYSLIEIVVPKVVWALGEKLDDLAALKDPRIKVMTPELTAQSLRALAATYESDFVPEAA